jgi:hypothetical protein
MRLELVFLPAVAAGLALIAGWLGRFDPGAVLRGGPATR